MNKTRKRYCITNDVWHVRSRSDNPKSYVYSEALFCQHLVGRILYDLPSILMKIG